MLPLKKQTVFQTICTDSEAVSDWAVPNAIS